MANPFWITNYWFVFCTHRKYPRSDYSKVQFLSLHHTDLSLATLNLYYLILLILHRSTSYNAYLNKTHKSSTLHKMQIVVNRFYHKTYANAMYLLHPDFSWNAHDGYSTLYLYCKKGQNACHCQTVKNHPYEKKNLHNNGYHKYNSHSRWILLAEHCQKNHSLDWKILAQK